MSLIIEAVLSTDTKETLADSGCLCSLMISEHHAQPPSRLLEAPVVPTQLDWITSITKIYISSSSQLQHWKVKLRSARSFANGTVKLISMPIARQGRILITQNNYVHAVRRTVAALSLRGARINYSQTDTSFHTQCADGLLAMQMLFSLCCSDLPRCQEIWWCVILVYNGLWASTHIWFFRVPALNPTLTSELLDFRLISPSLLIP